MHGVITNANQTIRSRGLSAHKSDSSSSHSFIHYEQLDEKTPAESPNHEVLTQLPNKRNHLQCAAYPSENPDDNNSRLTSIDIKVSPLQDMVRPMSLSTACPPIDHHASEYFLYGRTNSSARHRRGHMQIQRLCVRCFARPPS